MLRLRKVAVLFDRREATSALPSVLGLAEALQECHPLETFEHELGPSEYQ